MKLRWKFFVILFVFSLIPLLIVTVISQRGTRRLGRVISADLRQNLTSLTSEALLQAVENSSKTLLQTMNSLESSLTVLAYEAEQALDEAASVINIDIGTFAVVSSLEDSHSIPRHNWFVQATNPTHRNTLDRLAKKLDAILCEKNRHYAIRRESQALGLPEVHSID